MKTFQEILSEELSKPVPVKGSTAQIYPMEAMARAVLSNAIKGDLASIAFISTITRGSDPEAENAHNAKMQKYRADFAASLQNQLENEGIWDGQQAELDMLADTAVLIEQLTEQMQSSDFQAILTDPKNGHQTVSPLIALRDKQRDIFQQQLEKLRRDAQNRQLIRRQLRK